MNTLREHLRYRRLLGWSVEPIVYSEELKRTGISEVSNNKGESDSDYILRQMAERVPLSFWCELLECDAETAAQKLRKSPPFSKYIYLVNAIFNFNDRQWACLLYTSKDSPETIFSQGGNCFTHDGYGSSMTDMTNFNVSDLSLIHI